MEATSSVDTIHSLVRPCPLCRSTSGHLIENLYFEVFDDSAITGDCSLVVCARCGFAFNDTSSSQADFDHYYRQNAYYYTATTAGTGGLGANDLKRFEKLYERVAPLIPNKQSSIFDIGCAKGGLLSVLAQRGYVHLYGVDMLPECASYIQETLGMSAETGSALELPFPEIHADVLVYSHVVEHVINLSVLVAAAHEKLSDDGIIYVEVPDASRYGEFTNNPYQDLYLEHVNHFDTSTLVALFGAGGFETVVTGRFELDAPPVGRVPCVWAVFRKGSISREKPNQALEQHLREYISWSRQHPALNRFAELAQAKTPLYLWGISQYAMLIMGQTALRNCDLRGLVDKDTSKRMRTLLGRPIESPEVLNNAEPECNVLVTASGYEDAISGELNAMDFRGVLLTASGVVVERRI